MRAAGAEKKDDWNGSAFVGRTLRSAAVTGAIVATILASYGQFWALGPFACGLGLSGALLLAWDLFVRGVLTPEAIRKAKRKGKDFRWPIVVFSLIKYPLVGLLLFKAVRIWRGDSNHALAFVGGFILLHAVVGLRAISRALVTDRAA